jgi:hypothetical protein
LKPEFNIWEIDQMVVDEKISRERAAQIRASQPAHVPNTNVFVGDASDAMQTVRSSADCGSRAPHCWLV